MKKVILYMLLTLAVASCSRSYEEQKRISREERARLHREDSLALKVAVVPTLDCLPLFVAKEHRMFDTLHVDVRLKYFTAQMDCDTALVGGTADGMVSDLVRTERLRRMGTDMLYLSSTGAYWQLITNSHARLKRVGQLGDKMVAMTRYSATDMLTDRVLDGVKTSSMVFRIQVNDVNVRLAMLLNNEMDAMWLTEPYATAARLHGHEVVADSRDMKLNLGVIAFKRKAVADARRKEQLAAFTKAYNMACDSLNSRGVGAYADVIGKYYKVDRKTVASLPKLRYRHIEKPAAKDIAAADGRKK